MSSKEGQKLALLKQMQSLLKKRKHFDESNYSQRSRLRFNLIEFGEEFLSQEAFDRLTWILEDGGVDLLPMKPLRKGSKRESEDSENEPPKKKQAPDSSLDSNADWLREKIETMSQKLENVENRLQAVESGSIQLPSAAGTPQVKPHPRCVEPKVVLPIKNSDTFEKMDELVQEDRNYYDRVVKAFNKEYNRMMENSGWFGVFDRILGKDLVRYYHLTQYKEKDELPWKGVNRKPIHTRFLVMTVFEDAFPNEDLFSVHLELRKWFQRCVNSIKQSMYRQGLKQTGNKSETEQVGEMQDSNSQDDIVVDSKTAFDSKIVFWLNKVRKVSRARKSREAKKKDASGAEEILFNVKNEMED